MCDSKNQKFLKSIKQLISKAGIEKSFELFPICRGGNNRAWMLKTRQKRYFLKQYFSSEHDKRDRFGNEIMFSKFAWEQGIRNIAKPLAADRENLLGLFAYIEGRQPVKEDVNQNVLELALKFVEYLNRDKKGIKSQALPPASEACFCFSDHFDNVTKRLTRLKNINTDRGDSIDKEAKQFIMDVLDPEWKTIKLEIEKKIMPHNFDLIKRIARDEMIISPSDFGFHNTILTEKNELFFVDFEYAGWDNPIKLVCDFFCQPEIPVSLDYFSWFSEKIIAVAVNNEQAQSEFVHFAKSLLPLYRLKWCCIMLNDFVPKDKDRRNFSFYHVDKRKNQLSKAIDYLKNSRNE